MLKIYNNIASLFIQNLIQDYNNQLPIILSYIKNMKHLNIQSFAFISLPCIFLLISRTHFFYLLLLLLLNSCFKRVPYCCYRFCSSAMTSYIVQWWWGGNPDEPNSISNLSLRDIYEIQRTWKPLYADAGRYGIKFFTRYVVDQY